jgi:hypothetical protein
VINRTPQIVRQRRLYEKIFSAFVLILSSPLIGNTKVIMDFSPMSARKRPFILLLSIEGHAGKHGMMDTRDGESWEIYLRRNIKREFVVSQVKKLYGCRSIWLEG